VVEQQERELEPLHLQVDMQVEKAGLDPDETKREKQVKEEKVMGKSAAIIRVKVSKVLVNG